MPSLKKKRNTWYAVFKDARRTPTEKWVPLGTRLKSAAKLKFNDLQRREADPHDTFDPWITDNHVSRHLSVREGIEAFLESRSHRRPQTLKKYRSYLQQWEKRLPAGLMLRDVRPDDVKLYFWEKKRGPEGPGSKGEKLTPNALHARARHLKAFFSWAVSSGYLEKNPVDEVELPRKQKKIPSYLTPEDVQRLLQAIEADYDIKAADGQAQPGEILWLRDVIKFAVSTGLRRGEVCALRWRAINLADGILTVGVQHETKGHHQRPVPLAQPAIEVLRGLYTPGANGFVFQGVRGGKLNGDYLGKVFKKYVRLARLPDDVSFHNLRHTCASWLVMNGVALRVVQEILGHGSMSTTEIYSHLAPGAMRKAMDDTFNNL